VVSPGTYIWVASILMAGIYVGTVPMQVISEFHSCRQFLCRSCFYPTHL